MNRELAFEGALIFYLNWYIIYVCNLKNYFYGDKNMSKGKLPDLLQFVPNMEIAENYLKNNFFLKDILCYNKINDSKNLKYDNDEGAMLYGKLEPYTCFISCFTILNPSFFYEKGGLKKTVIDGLNPGNVNKDGEYIERPFITISSKNFLKIIFTLQKVISDYFTKQKIINSGLVTRGVEYLEDNDYDKVAFKCGEKMDKLPHVCLGNKQTSVVTKFDKQQRETYEECMKLLCYTKREFFYTQNEYRFMIVLYSGKINNSELEIPIPDLHDYVKVHKYSDIHKITKNDL